MDVGEARRLKHLRFNKSDKENFLNSSPTSTLKGPPFFSFSELLKCVKDFPWSSVGELHRGFLLSPVKSATSFLQIHMNHIRTSGSTAGFSSKQSLRLVQD